MVVLERKAYWLPTTNGHLPSVNSEHTCVLRLTTFHWPLNITSTEEKTLRDAMGAVNQTATWICTFRDIRQKAPVPQPDIVIFVGDGMLPGSKEIVNKNKERFKTEHERLESRGTYTSRTEEEDFGPKPLPPQRVKGMHIFWTFSYFSVFGCASNESAETTDRFKQFLTFYTREYLESNEIDSKLTCD